MGGYCSLLDPIDDFNESAPITLSPDQEYFREGQIPYVNQNRSTFNDDDPIDVPNKSRNNQQSYDMMQQRNYILSENLETQIESMVKRCVGIAKQGGVGNVALMVSLKTREIQLQDLNGRITQRPGIDLICVIDHSGSMVGDKIKLVKRTLKHMLEFLNPQDRLCLIQFDCKCYRLTRLMNVTPQNIEKFRIAIHSIQARGGTDIENGMHMAFSVLKHRQYKNSIAAIFLLSDGQDDEAEERVRKTLSKITIKDTFTIKTFGFGIDVCPKIMNEIAHMKEGQFYFVPDLNQIDQCFMEALGGLVSVISNNLRIFVKITGPGFSRIMKTYGDKWQYDSWSGTYSLYQPHLLSGVKKSFIFEVNVPMNSNEQTFADIRIETEPIEKGDKFLFQQLVPINSNPVDQKSQNEVISNLMRVRGAEAFNQAQIHAENGDFQQGQLVIEQQINQMQQQNLNDAQMQMVMNDLQQARSYCDPFRYQQEGGRHQMMQLHNVHMYQKSRGVQMANSYGYKIDCTYQNNIQKNYKDQVNQMNKFQQ